MNGNNERRMVWLLSGVLVGIALASLWPAEEAQAIATDRNDRFAICTVPVGPGVASAVFVLDFVTGRLTGALMNTQSGLFTNYYFRNVAEDFLTKSSGKPKFAMIGGEGNLNSGQGVTTSTGVLYIGEMTSGKVAVYRFPYRNQRDKNPQIQPLQPLDYYEFRPAE